MEFTTEQLANGTRVLVNSSHRFGTDAMLLSHFCAVKRLEAACDFGTGCGIIPLRWKDMGHTALAVGVELDSMGAQLFKMAIAENNLSNIISINGDIKKFTTEKLFDVVSCNPPYFIGGIVSENKARAGARHQINCTTADMCKAASKILKDGGRFCVCQRPSNLADVMCEMRKAKIEPKRLRFVKQRTGQNEPWLFLLDGRKNGGVGLSVLPDLIMEDEQGGFSKEVLQIYGKIK